MMADFGLFIGWGDPVRGREQKSAVVFNEAVELWSRLQAEGEIESWEAVFLEPHGGDLGGFFLLRGDRESLARVRGSDEMSRLTTRANLIVDNFGVVGAEMGDRVATQMAAFLEFAAELA
jgi:hypothetical protein